MTDRSHPRYIISCRGGGGGLSAGLCDGGWKARVAGGGAEGSQGDPRGDPRGQNRKASRRGKLSPAPGPGPRLPSRGHARRWAGTR